MVKLKPLFISGRQTSSCIQIRAELGKKKSTRVFIRLWYYVVFSLMKLPQIWLSRTLIVNIWPTGSLFLLVGPIQDTHYSGYLNDLSNLANIYYDSRLTLSAFLALTSWLYEIQYHILISHLHPSNFCRS